MDIQTGKISNRLIITGLILGFIRSLCVYGLKGSFYFLIQVSLPVLVFYLLFLMRALGAGDIKLFSVISSCTGLKGLIRIIFYSFLVGAAFSAAVIIRNKNLFSRIKYLSGYIQTVLLTKSIKRYDFKSDGKQNCIHFSVAILIGYFIYLGGM